MNDRETTTRKHVWTFTKVAMTVIISVIALLGILACVLFHANWAAERDARAFCDQVKVGSNISFAIAKAEREKVFNGKRADSLSYTFYFFGAFFDKAVCEVSVNQSGKVTSKYSEMEYD